MPMTTMPATMAQPLQQLGDVTARMASPTTPSAPSSSRSTMIAAIAAAMKTPMSTNMAIPPGVCRTPCAAAWSVNRSSDESGTSRDKSCDASGMTSGQKAAPTPSAAEQKEALTRLVVRLRLIAAHSLSADREYLEELSRYEMKFEVREYRDGRAPDVSMRPIALVPIEKLESAVARVRPLLLKSDGIGYAQIFDWLQDELGDDAARALADARKRFEAFDPDYPSGRPYDAHKPGTPVTNRRLAGAWLYGSLVHADAVRQSYAAHVTLEALQVEAQRVVAGLLLASLDTLDLLRRIASEGKIEVEESAWNVDVVASKSTWAPTVTDVYTAPVGTPMPTSVEEPLAPEWQSWRGDASDHS